MRIFLVFGAYFLMVFSSSGQISDFIHIDQFGYSENSEKVAVLSNPQAGFNASQTYQAGNTLEIRSSIDNSVVFSGSPTVWNNGITHNLSGDRGWWFDFSSLVTSGTYYVFDPSNGQTSAEFNIGINPFQSVLKDTGRMFFYNRCNAEKAAPFADPNWVDGMNFTNPLQDANCRFIYDPQNAQLERDLTGGWFDAGDYNKYVSFTYTTLHSLLNAYEENPNAFGDDWNIPESGNGIPDILDEIKWELDWLLKMCNSDGSVHNKMGSQNYAENISSPPSTNTDPRFYGPTCTSASVSVASIFAHASIIFETYASTFGYAQILKDQAELCYGYVLPRYNANTLELNCDDGSIVSGDADMDAQTQFECLLTSAIYLFELTDDAGYQQFIDSEYLNSEPVYSNYWGAERLQSIEALLRYTGNSNATQATTAAILSNIQADVAADAFNSYKWSNEDLYRSQIPDWSYYWGSNKIKADYGNLSFLLSRYNINNDGPQYERKGNELIHYFHGVNPLGMVMLSNMYGRGGERCVNEIYHTWFFDGTDFDNALTSAYGPAPGFLTGGPNEYFSQTNLSPPSNQPALKSYLDFNDNNQSSWEITEPAIYYQAAYIRLLANAVTAASGNVGITEIAEENQIQVYPDPSRSELHITNLPKDAHLSICSTSGVVISNLGLSKVHETIDISQLASGFYLLRVQSPHQQSSEVLRFQKL